jgi:hypothetical protein
MIYDQEWNNKYENIYTLPNKKILETNYIIQDSNMNLIVNKLNFDVSFPATFATKRKILNDLRIYIKVSMSIIPNLKQSLIITDIILEPLLINLSVKQFIYLWEFYSMSMKFLYYDMVEKYIPLMKPEYLINGIPKRKKKTFKECFKRIVIAKKLQKKMKKDLKILEKKGEKMIMLTQLILIHILNVMIQIILGVYHYSMLIFQIYMLNSYQIVKLRIKKIWVMLF